MATVVALLIFAGFTPSVYARGWSSEAAPLPLPVIVHGVAGTLFVLTFAVQSWLIAARRVSWHRKLGPVGALLAIALVTSGLIVTIRFELGHSPEPGRVFAAHVGSNAIPLTLFALLVAAGIWQRGVATRHKRLMLLAAVVLMPPATLRLFALLDVTWLHVPVFAGAAAANAVYDVMTRGRPHTLSASLAAVLIAMDIAIPRWLDAVA